MVYFFPSCLTNKYIFQQQRRKICLILFLVVDLRTSREWFDTPLALCYVAFYLDTDTSLKILSHFSFASLKFFFRAAKTVRK